MQTKYQKKINLDFLFHVRNELINIRSSMESVYRILNKCKILSKEEQELFFMPLNELIKKVENKIEQRNRETEEETV